MAEYGYIDTSIAGLIQGLDNNIEGRFAAGEDIEFGAGVFGYIGEDKLVYNYHLDVAKLVYDADFVTDNDIDVTVNGVAITTVEFDTDHDTTAANLAAAIDGLTGVECILDTTDVNNRTFLIRIKGEDAVVSSVVTNGASQAVATVTYYSGQVFMGVSVFVQNSAGLYEQYDAVSVLTSGMITVVPKTTVESYATAYIINSGANKGLFGSSGFAINARYTENASADGFTVLEVNGKSNETYAGTF